MSYDARGTREERKMNYTLRVVSMSFVGFRLLKEPTFAFDSLMVVSSGITWIWERVIGSWVSNWKNDVGPRSSINLDSGNTAAWGGFARLQFSSHTIEMITKENLHICRLDCEQPFSHVTHLRYEHQVQWTTGIAHHKAWTIGRNGTVP